MLWQLLSTVRLIPRYSAKQAYFKVTSSYFSSSCFCRAEILSKPLIKPEIDVVDGEKIAEVDEKSDKTPLNLGEKQSNGSKYADISCILLDLVKPPKETLISKSFLTYYSVDNSTLKIRSKDQIRSYKEAPLLEDGKLIHNLSKNAVEKVPPIDYSSSLYALLEYETTKNDKVETDFVMTTSVTRRLMTSAIKFSGSKDRKLARVPDLDICTVKDHIIISRSSPPKQAEKYLKNVSKYLEFHKVLTGASEMTNSYFKTINKLKISDTDNTVNVVLTCCSQLQEDSSKPVETLSNYIKYTLESPFQTSGAAFDAKLFTLCCEAQLTGSEKLYLGTLSDTGELMSIEKLEFDSVMSSLTSYDLEFAKSWLLFVLKWIKENIQFGQDDQVVWKLVTRENKLHLLKSDDPDVVKEVLSKYPSSYFQLKR